MVYVQLPIVGLREVTTFDTFDTATPPVKTGTATVGKIKDVFPVPYFGKYKVRIINNVLSALTYNEFFTIKSQVLTNPGSPGGVLAFLSGTTATIVNYPVPLEFICNINGFIDYEITTLNPNSTAMTTITTSSQTGVAPNLVPGSTIFKYAMITLELTKIED